MSKVTEEAVKALTMNLADQGRIIEAGWVGYSLLLSPDAGEVQRWETRQAFFAGAQHLFSSIFTFIESDDGEEPTPGDLDRMSKVHAELDAFRKELEERARKMGLG